MFSLFKCFISAPYLHYLFQKMLQCKEKLLSGLKNLLLAEQIKNLSFTLPTDLHVEEQLYNV